MYWCFFAFHIFFTFIFALWHLRVQLAVVITPTIDTLLYQSWDDAAEEYDRRAMRRRDEEDIPKYKKLTHNLTWFHRSNRSCVCPQRRERNFIKLWGKIMRNTYSSH